MRYFSMKEFTRSATADRLKIDNSLPPELLDAATYTLQRLDDIRAGYGKPIVITSGYRCPALNKVVGGKPNSQHQKAQAADLKWDNELLAYLLQHAHFDQLIEESSKRTKWLHISFLPTGERNMYLRLRV